MCDMSSTFSCDVSLRLAESASGSVACGNGCLASLVLGECLCEDLYY